MTTTTPTTISGWWWIVFVVVALVLNSVRHRLFPRRAVRLDITVGKPTKQKEPNNGKEGRSSGR